MSKKNFADINEKIAEKVVGAYKTIENGTVSGYKKIESAAVKGYGKTEDFFIDKLFRKDGETVEEAKERLKAAASPKVDGEEGKHERD